MSEITKIFIGNLPHGTKPAELKHVFEDFGVVVECDVMNRCGFVHMSTFDMADSAITALNGTEFRGQQIVVEAGKPKERAIAMARGNRGGSIAAIGGSVRDTAGQGRGNDGEAIVQGIGRGRGGFSSRGGNRGRGNMFHGDGLSTSRGGFISRGRGNYSHNGGTGPVRGPAFKKIRNNPYVQGGSYGLQDYSETGQFGVPSPTPPKYGGYSRGGGNFNNRSAGSNYTHNPEPSQNRFQNFNESEDFYATQNKFTQRGGGKFGRGKTGNFGGQPEQDRRGFALPPPQQQSPPPLPHYVTDIPNCESEDYALSHQGISNSVHNTKVPGTRGGRGNFRGHRGSFQSDRGTFNSPRGAFNDSRPGFRRVNQREAIPNESTDYQGAFESHRGGYMSERGPSGFRRGGGSGAPFTAQSSYEADFPPLRGGGGGNSFRGGRGSGPGFISRQNPMGNRRFN